MTFWHLQKECKLLKDTPPPKVLPSIGRAIKEATAANLLNTLEKRMNELESIKGLGEGCNSFSVVTLTHSYHQLEYTHIVALSLSTKNETNFFRGQA